jgi:hypothetical protein
MAALLKKKVENKNEGLLKRDAKFPCGLRSQWGQALRH